MFSQVRKGVRGFQTLSRASSQERATPTRTRQRQHHRHKVRRVGEAGMPQRGDLADIRKQRNNESSKNQGLFRGLSLVGSSETDDTLLHPYVPLTIWLPMGTFCKVSRQNPMAHCRKTCHDQRQCIPEMQRGIRKSVL